jgi:signal transduction histidine kinase
MIYEITRLNLENEMDLVLAHKRSIRLGERLNLSISNQTTFTTAISECCREVIERAGVGLLIVQVVQEEERHSLQAIVRYKDPGNQTSGRSTLDYAKKLVSQLRIYSDASLTNVELKINIPRSARLNETRIAEIIEYFRKDYADTPYEQVKQKKEALKLIASEQEEQLIRSRYVNEKKTEFLSIASHELKTPLTTIKAFAQLAMDEQDADTVRMYLSKINTQSDKLYKLIQQLLDVSKIEAGRLDFIMEETEMNSYVEETVGLISKSIPSHRIIMDLGPNVIARIDKLRVEQVFSNILVNAAKYSKENTTIRLITSVQTGNILRISIQDEGIGMTSQNIRRVFEKFFRVEEIARTYSGLGMGLYIASRIISGHQGNIWIDSEVDIGSTFHFSLPFLHAAEA